MRYESPIKVMQTSIKHQMEGEIMKAVVKFGVDVDKDELVKALRYDRGQYEKGYADGYEAAHLRHGKWVAFGAEFYRTKWYCSECGRIETFHKDDLHNYPYCHCGAKMDGDAE